MPLLLASAAAAIAVAAPATPTRLFPLALDPSKGRVELVAMGPLAVREYRLAAPARLVVEFEGARIAEDPTRLPVAPGAPIRSGGLYQVAPDLVRGVFMADDPARLAWHAEPMGRRFSRIVIGPARPAAAPDPTAREAVAAALRPRPARIAAVRWRDGALEVQADRPLVARISPQVGGYELAFANAELAAGLAGAVLEPGGDVRRVRVLPADGAGGTRLAFELTRPAAFRQRAAGGVWTWAPAPDGAAAKAPPLARLPEPWAVMLRPPRLPAIAARRRPDAARLGDAVTAWRAGSHFLFTSNVAQFGQGPALVGTRHRYGGSLAQQVPLGQSWLVGHLDTQLLRFADPRFDYVNTLGSVALAHALVPGVHVFEGAAGLHRKEAYASTVALFDGSLFAGLGSWGGLGSGGLWAASLVVDRVTAASLRQSYYGQALRLRGQLPLGPTLALSAQATVQRLDPVVRSQPYFREYLDFGAEWALTPDVRLGLMLQAGLQQRGAVEGFVLGGPSFHYAF